MEKKRSRSFVFTINNYTIEDLKVFQSSVIKNQSSYYILGFEIGEKGTPHIQGYIHFYNAKTFIQLKKIITRGHIEITHGSIQENIAYCSKDNHYVEYGEHPQPGIRNDLKNIKEKVMNHTPINDIIRDDIENLQQLKFMETMLRYQQPKERIKPKVMWYYGGTGVGKTKEAIEYANNINEEYYISMKNLNWWDGYIGQKVVIIDDFRKDFCTFHELLRILDRYPYRVNIKGSSMWFEPEHIIITSCYKPDEVYDTREDIGQLLRRVDIVRLFKGNKKYIDYITNENTSF